MAQAGYTPIQLYYSTTAAAVPVNTNLASGELALNIQDEKLYFKNAAGTVKLLASNATSAPVTSFQTSLSGLTPSTSTTGAVTLAGTLGTANGGTNLTSFTSGGVVYASSGSALATGSALNFDGTNLGIGSSPTAKLHIGVANAAVDGTKGVKITNVAGTTAVFECGISNDSFIGTTSGSDFNIRTGNAELVRFTSAGNVGIGTTSPSDKLTVVGSINLPTVNSYIRGGGHDVIQVDATRTYFYGGTSGIQMRSSNNALALFEMSDAGVFTFSPSGTERARIQTGFSVGTTADPGAGAIYATGNITAYYSDSRLKTVSGKIENALDKVAQLSGVYYTNNDIAKSFGYDSDEVQVGVLAQDVEAVLPQIVKAAPFDLDENNNSKSGENYKTVQYERLVPLLIEAINELRAEVKALKGE